MPFSFPPPLCVSHSAQGVRLSATPWTVTHQAPLSMGFSRQEYWNGLPRPPPRDLPDPGIEPESLMSPAPKKVHLVKVMVFTVVMYGCEGWTVKKAER